MRGRGAPSRTSRAARLDQVKSRVVLDTLNIIRMPGRMVRSESSMSHRRVEEELVQQSAPPGASDVELDCWRAGTQLGAELAVADGSGFRRLLPPVPAPEVRSRQADC